MPVINVEIDRMEIERFCKRNRIKKLSLFGSVLRADFNSDSDIDVLVEFEPNCTPGYAFIGMEDELSAIFGGRKVDLVTPKFMNDRIRARVLAETEVIYG